MPYEDSDDEPSKTESTNHDTTNYPASQACSVLPQDGCPSTHTCQIVSRSGATMCESAGSVGLGGSCNANTECAAGFTCWFGRCRSYCATPDDCSGPAPSCLDVTSGGQPVAGLRVCSIQCSPADPQNVGGAAELVGCPNGWTCFPAGDGTAQGATDCGPGGGLPQGASCDQWADCQPGLVCLSDGPNSSCTPLCIKGVTSCNCGSFAEPMFVALSGGMFELGYCL